MFLLTQVLFRKTKIKIVGVRTTAQGKHWIITAVLKIS